MTFFEAMVLGAPIAGALAGATTGADTGWVAACLGAVVGGLSGILVYVSSMPLQLLLLWILASESVDKREYLLLQWIAMPLFLGVYLSLPVCSCFAASTVVAGIVQFWVA